jgi:hypothetical protein
LRISSGVSGVVGCVSPAKGNFVQTVSPSAWAATFAWVFRSAGMATLKGFSRISPVASSSRRDSSARARRKLSGTTPEASPE